MNELRDDVIIVLVLHEIDDPDDLRVTLLAEYGQLVLQKLQVHLPLPDHLLLHNLERKLGPRVDVNAFSNLSKSAAAQKVTHLIFFTDVVDFFELLVIHHAQHPLLRQLPRCRLT